MKWNHLIEADDRILHLTKEYRSGNREAAIQLDRELRRTRGGSFHFWTEVIDDVPYDDLVKALWVNSGVREDRAIYHVSLFEDAINGSDVIINIEIGDLDNYATLDEMLTIARDNNITVDDSLVMHLSYSFSTATDANAMLLNQDRVRISNAIRRRIADANRVPPLDLERYL